MSLLDTIKDQVSREKYNASWDNLLYDMYPDDTYVNDALSRYDIDIMMEEVASRYAKAVAEDALKRAAEGAKTKYVPADEFDEPGDFVVDKQSILSTEINLDL